VVWWLCYAVAAAVVVVLFVFADAWWMRGAIALIAVISVIRFVQAEKELREKFRGHCRACGYDVYVDDPWCPHCGGSVKDVR
jgi:membrane protein YdbS with pleckstrin-like domain